MKKYLLLICCLSIAISGYAQNSVGIGTSSPAATAVLDISSTSKGLLIPRMNTMQRSEIVSPAQGLLVFDTNLNGFYFFNGSSWTAVNSTPAADGWGVYGNAGTNPGSNFIGTADNQSLVFKVNSQRFGMFDKNNSLFIGLQSGPSNLGYNNIGIGTKALFNNTVTNNLVAIGDSALYANGFGAGTTNGLRNTAIGSKTLAANTTGNNNTATGFEALRSNISGHFNTAMGALALTKNTGPHNTAIGNQALAANIGGEYNTAVGSNSLLTNTEGDDNTAVGAGALTYNTLGNENVAMGLGSLYFNQTGSANVAVGSYALQATNGGNRNVGLGKSSMYYNTTGNQNVAVGSTALYSNTTRSFLVAVGDSALFYNGTGAFNITHSTANTAVGARALLTNSTGYQNTGLGYNSLYANSTGSSNTAIGAYALQANMTGSENFAAGRSALYYNTAGSNNIAIGTTSLFNNTGDNNTAVGVGAMSVNTVGDYNTGLGFNADVNANNLTNATAIGYNATVSASNKIRLGNTAVTSIEGQVNFTTSDARFKTNINDNVPGLDLITALKPFTYQYKSYELDQFLNKNNKTKAASMKKEDYAAAESMVHMGFMAQDVDKLLKEKGYKLSLVHTPQNESDNYSIAYSELIPALVKAVQEQQAQIESLKKQLQQTNK